MSDTSVAEERLYMPLTNKTMQDIIESYCHSNIGIFELLHTMIDFSRALHDYRFHMLTV